MNNKVVSVKNAIKIYTRLLKYQKSKLWISIPCIVASGVSTFLVFSTTGVLLRNIMQISTGKPLQEVLKQSILYVLIVLIFALISGFAPVGVAYVQELTRKKLREEMLLNWTNVNEISASNVHTSDVVMRLNDDLNKTTDLVGNFINLWFINPMISGFISLIVVITINWRIGVYCLLSSTLYLIITRILLKRSSIIKKHIQEQKAKITEKFSHMISGATDIRVFQLENKLLKGFIEKSNNLLRNKISYGKIYSLRIVALKFSDFLNIAGLLVLGAYLAKKQIITFDQIMIALPLSDQIAQLINGVSNMWAAIVERSASVDRVFEIIDCKQESIHNVHSKPLEMNEDVEAVKFSNVNFSYREGVPILNDISFSVKHGSTVAFVGESGSGKTSIFNLLMGLYTPSSGEIYAYGCPLSSSNIKEWRTWFSYVQQLSPLFDVSIRENIALGRANLEVSEEDIKQAAHAANADVFIKNLPSAYDYIAGESGQKLSGGQRQRIAIARSLLRKAPVLLFDEATAALDNESEMMIRQTINSTKGKYTTLIISHKLSAVCDADYIIVMDCGSIIEKGTHDELIKSNGRYAKMWNIQTGKSDTPLSYNVN